MGEDRIIYDGALYRVILHGGEITHPVTIVGFQPLIPLFNPVFVDGYPTPFLPPALTQSGFPANFISFLVNRNTWYCDAEAQVAAAEIAKAAAGSRVVTYGSSMGGHGAMVLAEALDAAFFVALSPQATAFHPLIGHIEGARFSTVLDPHSSNGVYDHLSNGEVRHREGVIFFDTFDAQDAIHAARAAVLTRAVLVDVPHAGHPVTPVLHSVYPLRKILRTIVDDNFDLGQTRQLVAEEIVKQPCYLAARPELLARFLRKVKVQPELVTVQCLSNAARTLSLYRNHWPDGGFAACLTQTRAEMVAFAPKWPAVWAKWQADVTRTLASLGD
jgi:hypothetical protein